MNEEYSSEKNNSTPADQILSGEPPKKEKKKKGKFWKVLGIVVLCAVLVALVAVGGNYLYKTYAPRLEDKGVIGLFKDEEAVQSEEPAPEENPENPVVKATPEAEEPKAEITDSKEKETKTEIVSDVLTPSQIYSENVDSIVAITTNGTVNYWGYQLQTGAKGSGFIISDDGYVLTNFHVVEDSESISIATFDGKEYSAQVIGCDASNDIAILKIDGTGFNPVTVGDSDSLQVGEDVYAIGNPLGDLTFSMTKGIVSALDRPVQLSNTQSMNLIQTDCAINSGNSGGALFNSKGEVVGITNAKYSSSGSSSEASIDNIGFAIPINSVWKLAGSIIKNGFAVKPYIGITGSDVSSDVIGATGLAGGAFVNSVTENSPASEAGILGNDIIIAFNGKDIKDFNSLKDEVSNCEPGDSVNLKVYRQGKTIDVVLTIGEQKVADSTSTSGAQSQQVQPGNGQFGNGYGQFGDGYGQFGDGYGQYDDGKGYDDFMFGNGNGIDSYEEFYNWIENFFR